MLKLSRLADYGVILMSEMALTRREIHSAQAMAETTGLPHPTVSKLLSLFARAGLLDATRGVNGGFRLGRPASTISMADIIHAVDGPVALTQCIERGPGTCGVESLCPSRRGWHAINTAVRQALESVTLADFIAPAGWPDATSVREPATVGQPPRHAAGIGG